MHHRQKRLCTRSASFTFLGIFGLKNQSHILQHCKQSKLNLSSECEMRIVLECANCTRWNTMFWRENSYIFYNERSSQNETLSDFQTLWLDGVFSNIAVGGMKICTKTSIINQKWADERSWWNTAGAKGQKGFPWFYTKLVFFCAATDPEFSLEVFSWVSLA